MMMAKVSALVVRSVRIYSELGSISQLTSFERDYRFAVSLQQSRPSSSTSSWGTGELPAENTDVRGETSEPISTSGYDTNTARGEEKQQTKKSRTGGDMTDDGQVHTPNLQKMRSTGDIINNAGKETEERLAADKKRAT